jgi:hypothetical protein
MKPLDHPQGPMLLAFADGELDAETAPRVSEHIAVCGECRAFVEVRNQVAEAVSSPQVSHGDLGRLVEQRIAAGEAMRRGLWAHLWATSALWRGGLAVGAFATVALLFVVPAADDDFRAKGVATVRDPNVGVQAYVVRDNALPRRFDGTLGADDGLLFAYRNDGAEPYSYLLIFAVDPAGELYWYYPAHIQEGGAPSSVRVSRAAEPLELHELTRHHLPAGPLFIYGLFTRSPLRVPDVEAALDEARVRRRWTPGDELPLAGSQEILRAEVLH